MCRAPDLDRVILEADRRPASELWHVHGRYYDLRPFLAAHPGGEFVLRQCMGSDCTALVYSHHLNNKPFDVLAKHLVQPSDAEKTMRLEYGRQTELDYSFEPNGFYLTVRGRVARYFAETGVRYPNQAGTYTLVKLVISIFLFWATWIHMCIAPFCMPIAFANGYLRLVLTGIGHDAIHHNVTPQIPWLNDMLFHVFGLFSAMDSSRWHYEHVVLHHPHTKTESDPDEELPLLRLSARAPWASIHCVHVASQIILGILLTYANAILEFIIYIVERGFGNENLRRAEGKPKRTNPLNGLISLFILQLLPFYFNEYEQAWRSSLFACGMYGIILLHTFHVSHIVEETSALPFKPGVDWGAHQLHTTANVHTWCEMGTLDLQIEHHLFPNLAYESQEKVRHIVAATAKEFGLPYFHHRSLLHAYGAHIDWMGKLGNGFMEATSTSTSTSAPTKKEQ
jgi:linoleoyl-CoA desaturase